MKFAPWIRFIDGAVFVSVRLVAIILALMALLLTFDSVGRSLFHAPLPGATDLVSYLWMPGLAILALGYAQLRDEQIRVTIISELALPRTRRVLEIASEVVGGLVVSLLAVLTAGVFLQSLEIGKGAQAARWVLLWPGQLLVVIGFGICALAAVARIYRLLSGSDAAQLTRNEEAEETYFD